MESKEDFIGDRKGEKGNTHENREVIPMRVDEKRVFQITTVMGTTDNIFSKTLTIII